jgi:glycosyltransferase involved in cell wall biosynthesis
MDLASILLVTKNNRQTIERCLSSIFRQSYRNIEVVIVDSSDDGSSSLIEKSIENDNKGSFDVKHIYAEAKGVGNARNTAISQSSGKYLFFIDADFYVDEDYVKRAVEIFSEDNKILSINFRKEFYPSEHGLFPEAIFLFDKARKPMNPNGLFEYWICQRKIFDIVGFFKNSLEALEDTEWEARANRVLKNLSVKEEYKVAIAPDIVSHEQKQCWSVSEYWRKSIWYGTAFADSNFFRETIKTSMFEIFFMLTQISLPFIISYSILIDLPGFVIFVLVFIFFLPTLFIAIRAVKRKIVTRSIILIPFLIFYKSLFLLAGTFLKLLKR